MNVRKRGLALLMCICMIFTLLPFSVFAENTVSGTVGGQSDPVSGTVYYGKDEGNGWNRNADGTSAAKNYSENNNNITYSKTAAKNDDGSYQVKLEIVSKTTTTSPGASAVVLVIDTSKSMKVCATCNNVPKENKYDDSKHSGSCTTGKTGEVELAESRLGAAKAAAVSFVNSYANVLGGARYISVVLFNAENNTEVLKEWSDVSNSTNRETVTKAITDLTFSNLNQGTYLNKGLDKAKDQLNNNTVKDLDNKFTIVLSDGEPSDKDSAKNSATALKNVGTIYTVCAGGAGHDFLKTYVATDENKAFLANDVTALNNAFADIFKDIEKGISAGFTVTDPMGANVNLNQNSIVGTGATVSGTTITWVPENVTPTTGENGEKIYTYTLTYKVTLDTDALDTAGKDGYVPLNGTTTLQFTDNKQTQTCYFNVPAVYYKVPTYTVTYSWTDEPKGKVTLPTDNTEYRKNQSVTVDATYSSTTSIDGGDGYTYTFSGWSANNVTIADGKFTMPAEAVTLTGTWTKTANKYNVSYTVTGAMPDNYSAPAPEQKEFNTKVDVKPVPDTTNTYPGYTFDGWNAPDGVTVDNDGKFTMPAKDVTFTGSFAKRTDLSYTVKHYWIGDLNKEIGTTVTKNDGTLGETKTVTTTQAATIDGYTIITNSDVQKNNSITIQANSSENVIKLYYYKNVTLTANSDKTVIYDGEEHKVTTFDVDIPADNKTDKSQTKFAESITAEGKGTNPGEYPVELYKDGTKITAGKELTPFVVGNYWVTKATEGKLIISKANTLVVTGEDYNDVYDGKEHGDAAVATVNNKKVEATITYKTSTDKQTWTEVRKAPTITNAGTLYVQVKAELTGYEDATDEYTLTVTPRAVTLSSAGATKIYDGQPLTNSKVTVTSGSFVDGEGVDITVTGEQTNFGNSDNTFTYVFKEDTLKDNYSITTECEKLYVNQRPITITGESAPKTITYDGKTHTYTSYTSNKQEIVNGVDNDKGLVEGHKIVAEYELSGKNPDTYTGKFGEIKIFDADNKDVTANYNIKTEAGTMTINRRPYIPPTPAKKIIVTITGNTGSEVYDATEHNVKGYTWECTDPSYTEKDFEFTGTADAKGTYVGKYDMGIKPDQFKNLNSAYDVEFVVETDGELDITKKPLTITAGSAEGYGPEAITCNTYTATELAKGDKLVSVKVTGKQSVPGSSANVASDAVIQDANGKDVTANYEIKYVDGTLTMLEILNKEDHFNYVIGYPDGTVRPNANITRAEVATIFFRLLTDDGRAEFDTKTSTFSDVADGQWYTRAIATLANAKIVSGYPDGSFRPNDSITRAEMATIIARFANLSADGSTFNDISGHWAQKYIELAAGNGWINGYSDGSFGPDKKITRAETFAMINRVLDRETESNDDLLPVDQMLNWSDNADTTEWYYRDMQEATNNHKCERIGDSEYEKWTEKLPEIDWASYQI